MEDLPKGRASLPAGRQKSENIQGQKRLFQKSLGLLSVQPVKNRVCSAVAKAKSSPESAEGKVLCSVPELTAISVKHESKSSHKTVTAESLEQNSHNTAKQDETVKSLSKPSRGQGRGVFMSRQHLGAKLCDESPKQQDCVEELQPRKSKTTNINSVVSSSEQHGSGMSNKATEQQEEVMQTTHSPQGGVLSMVVAKLPDLVLCQSGKEKRIAADSLAKSRAVRDNEYRGTTKGVTISSSWKHQDKSSEDNQQRKKESSRRPLRKTGRNLFQAPMHTQDNIPKKPRTSHKPEMFYHSKRLARGKENVRVNRRNTCNSTSSRGIDVEKVPSSRSKLQSTCSPETKPSISPSDERSIEDWDEEIEEAQDSGPEPPGLNSSLSSGLTKPQCEQSDCKLGREEESLHSIAVQTHTFGHNVDVQEKQNSTESSQLCSLKLAALFQTFQSEDKSNIGLASCIQQKSDLDKLATSACRVTCPRDSKSVSKIVTESKDENKNDNMASQQHDKSENLEKIMEEPTGSCRKNSGVGFGNLLRNIGRAKSYEASNSQDKNGKAASLPNRNGEMTEVCCSNLNSSAVKPFSEMEASSTITSGIAPAESISDGKCLEETTTEKFGGEQLDKDSRTNLGSREKSQESVHCHDLARVNGQVQSQTLRHKLQGQKMASAYEGVYFKEENEPDLLRMRREQSRPDRNISGEGGCNSAVRYNTCHERHVQTVNGLADYEDICTMKLENVSLSDHPDSFDDIEENGEESNNSLKEITDPYNRYNMPQVTRQRPQTVQSYVENIPESTCQRPQTEQSNLEDIPELACLRPQTVQSYVENISEAARQRPQTEQSHVENNPEAERQIPRTEQSYVDNMPEFACQKPCTVQSYVENIPEAWRQRPRTYSMQSTDKMLCKLSSGLSDQGSESEMDNVMGSQSDSEFSPFFHISPEERCSLQTQLNFNPALACHHYTQKDAQQHRFQAQCGEISFKSRKQFFPLPYLAEPIGELCLTPAEFSKETAKILNFLHDCCEKINVDAGAYPDCCRIGAKIRVDLVSSEPLRICPGGPSISQESRLGYAHYADYASLCDSPACPHPMWLSPGSFQGFPSHTMATYRPDTRVFHPPSLHRPFSCLPEHYAGTRGWSTEPTGFNSGIVSYQPPVYHHPQEKMKPLHEIGPVEKHSPSELNEPPIKLKGTASSEDYQANKQNDLQTSEATPNRYILNDTSRNEDGSIPSEGSLKRARKKIEYNLTSVSSFLTPERLKNPMVSKRSVDGQGQSNRPKITHHPKPPLKSFLSDSDVTALSSPQATNNVHFTVKRESPQQGNEINQSAGENVYLECLPQASNGIHCTVTREPPQQGKSTSQSVRENVYPESGQETVANFLRSRKTNLDSSGFRNLSAEARVSGGAFRDCRASEDFSHRKPVNSNQKFLPGLVPSGADCSNWREHCKPLGPADPALSTHLVEASGRSTCRPKRRSERDDTGESRLPSSKLSNLRGRRSDPGCLEANDDLRQAKRVSWLNAFNLRGQMYQVPFIDTHCHIDFLYGRLGVNQDTSFHKFCLDNRDYFPTNFEGCVAVFCNPKTFAYPKSCDTVLKAVENDDNVWLALGCHPKNATEFEDRHYHGLSRALQRRKVVALGEIGLDYSGHFGQFADTQKSVMIQQLKLAVEMNLPLVIHCREADDDCLEILQANLTKDHKIHAHCFTRSMDVACRWMDAFPNLWLGLTPLVSYKSALDTIDTARHIPLDRLLLETDAPYFVPGQLRDANVPYSYPGFALSTAETVADLKGIEVTEVLTACRKNTRAMYGI